MISGDRSILEGKKGAFYYTLEEFSKHWGRIDVICPRGNLVKSPFKNVHFHPSKKSIWWQECHIRKVGLKLIEEHKHDVMTVHDYPPFYNGAGAMFLGKKTKIPYALEVHHIVGYPKAADFKEWMGRLMSKSYFKTAPKKATAVRVVNDSVGKTLKEWGVEPKKIHTVSSLYLDKDLLSSVKKSSAQYDLSFCGRLVANKGLSEVLDAVDRLESRTLLVIGDGPERKKLEAKAKSLGIQGRVTFVGWLPDNASVMEAIASAKIFVMNSKSEGGPRVALEAMACGMPVVSTNVGVMPDVIKDGENGVFSSGTPEDLVDKIQTLLAHEAECVEIGNKAKEVLKRFDRATLIAAYADFLKSLV